MPSCIVVGCKTSSKKVKVFSLPSAKNEPQRLSKWLEVSGNKIITIQEADNFTKRRLYGICENHFTVHAYANHMQYSMMGGRLLLRKDAVPTLNLCVPTGVTDANVEVSNSITVATKKVMACILEPKREKNDQLPVYLKNVESCSASNSPSLSSSFSAQTLPSSMTPSSSFKKDKVDYHNCSTFSTNIETVTGMVKTVACGTQTTVTVKHVGIQVQLKTKDTATTCSMDDVFRLKTPVQNKSSIPHLR